MTAVGLGMDALLGLLLLAALAVGLRLNGRLRGLREGQASFVRAVGDLDAAAMRAEAGLSALRAATVDAHDHLLDRIDTARALAARLETAVETGSASCSRLERAVAEATCAVVNAGPGDPHPVSPPLLHEPARRIDARSATPPAPIPARPPRSAPPPVVAPTEVEDAEGALARFVARRGARTASAPR